MAWFKVTGKVYFHVIRHDTETVRVDTIIEAESLSQAQEIAEDQAENDVWDADESELEDSRLTVTRLPDETAEELTEKESIAIYKSMVASGAPRLPGMGVA